MPLVRHAVIASSFGLRFKVRGYFPTAARAHRSTSGAPVVMRVVEPGPALAASAAYAASAAPAGNRWSRKSANFLSSLVRCASNQRWRNANGAEFDANPLVFFSMN